MIIACMIALFVKMTANRSSASYENAYGLVNTCVLSVPANDRTKTDIENCYLRVEKQYSLDLERFYPNE